MRKILSSESVTPGHPDKMCDIISDAVLDSILAQDPQGRVACETAAKTGNIFILGEITTKCYIEIPDVVRAAVRRIGYTADFGLDPDTCGVLVGVTRQSPDISQGVTEGEGEFKEQGAGDQGMMFGYATNETPELMPLPILLAHKLAKRLTEVRQQGILPYLGPDGKSQVAVNYVKDRPVNLENVIIAAQHKADVEMEQLREDIKNKVILPVCGDYLKKGTEFFINATGRFVLGGPVADAGLTGRKIIVDTYGGIGRHGGGAFSGKDPTKVDRSGAYAARYVAKNIVAAGLADKCEVQIAYVIGKAEPTSIYVDTFKTNKVCERKIAKLIRDVFPLKPADIIRELDLRRPIYEKTAAFGHFGRQNPEFSWEKTDKAAYLKKTLLGK